MWRFHVLVFLVIIIIIWNGGKRRSGSSRIKRCALSHWHSITYLCAHNEAKRNAWKQTQFNLKSLRHWPSSCLSGRLHSDHSDVRIKIQLMKGRWEQLHMVPFFKRKARWAKARAHEWNVESTCGRSLIVCNKMLNISHALGQFPLFLRPGPERRALGAYAVPSLRPLPN